MRTAYRMLHQGGTGEITEKKSRFIASLRPVKTEEEALAFVEEIKKKYWDARHNCYAWVIGEQGEQKRCSDDGEPSQTAGKPMLDVLEGEEIKNICAVVTRYFGGTLLGTGGLVRAYSGAVKEGLRNSVILDVYPAVKTVITTDYNGAGKIQYLLGQQELVVLDSQYTDKVEFTVLVPEEKRKAVENSITEASKGRAGFKELAAVYYGCYEKQVIFSSGCGMEREKGKE